MFPLALLLVAMVALLVPRRAHARRQANYDEAKVPPFTLPDPLAAADGTPVADADAWFHVRRPELLELFAVHVYGHTPQKPFDLRYDVFDEADDALDGKVRRRQVRVTCSTPAGEIGFDLLLYLPHADRPVPTFLALNFWGNHTVQPDRAIRITDSWMREGEWVADHRATEAGRGEWRTGGRSCASPRRVTAGHAVLRRYRPRLSTVSKRRAPLFMNPVRTSRSPTNGVRSVPGLGD